MSSPTASAPANRFVMPPWSMLALAALISLVLLALLVRDRHQQRDLTTRVLFEKGTSLIRAVEGALRTGVGFQWTDEELEDLLDQMGQQPDISFVAIASEKGLVLASNTPDQRRTQILSSPTLNELPPPPATRWQYDADHLLVYGVLTVPKFQERLNAYGHRRGHGRGHGRRGSMTAPILAPDQPLVLVAAYSDAPILEAATLDTRHQYTLLALLAVVNIAGLAGFQFLRLLETTRHEARQKIESLQTALRQRERLAVLGNMAAGIAHEIRNPLGAIKGLALFFKENSATDSEEARVADIMTREVLRLDNVVGDLLDLARPAALHPAPVNVQELVERLQRLLEPDLAHQSAQLHTDIPPDTPPMEADSDRVTQILLNLALNSLQAGSTSLTLQAARQGRLLQLRLTDNGSGMDDKTLQHIFTPYFTTKAKGTGLGLPIVHKIMEEHGGSIELHSIPGKGTTATLCFPLASPKAASA